MPVVYLDLDGVLADFVGGVCQAFNIPRETLLETWTPGQYDLCPPLKVSANHFWDVISRRGEEFWANLGVMPDAYELVALAEQRGEVVFMTSPPLNPSAVVGKIRWIEKHFPTFRRRFAVTPCKAAFAHPYAVLVDDWDEAVTKFRKAGGSGHPRSPPLEQLARGCGPHCGGPVPVEPDLGRDAVKAKLYYAWRFFLAFTRLSLAAVCEMSKEGWEFHDFRDDVLGLPLHFIPLQCQRCRKQFYL